MADNTIKEMSTYNYLCNKYDIDLVNILFFALDLDLTRSMPVHGKRGSGNTTLMCLEIALTEAQTNKTVTISNGLIPSPEGPKPPDYEVNVTELKIAMDCINHMREALQSTITLHFKSGETCVRYVSNEKGFWRHNIRDSKGRRPIRVEWSNPDIEPPEDMKLQIYSSIFEDLVSVMAGGGKYSNICDLVPNNRWLEKVGIEQMAVSKLDHNKMVAEIKEEYTDEELAKKWAPRNTNKQLLTKERLATFLPKGSSTKLTDELLAKINSVEVATGMDQGLFEEQLCSYAHLIGPGISLEKLMNAIKYVTLREVMGGSAKAYRVVFPEKTVEIEARGATVDNFASMYANTKAVIEVQKLVMIGVHITHAPLRNQLLQKMVNLSNGVGAKPDDYVSPTVQLNATIAAYDAVKIPDDNSMELKIGMSDSAMDSQNNLAEQIGKMAEIQMKNFQAGKSLNEVQRLNIVHEAEAIDD